MGVAAPLAGQTQPEPSLLSAWLLPRLPGWARSVTSASKQLCQSTGGNRAGGFPRVFRRELQENTMTRIRSRFHGHFIK